jgi:hypothetical protein
MALADASIEADDLHMWYGARDAPRGSVQAVIGRYRKTFEQESVRWETARVCVAS